MQLSLSSGTDYENYKIGQVFPELRLPEIRRIIQAANFNSLSTDVLFSQKIVERANENKKPRDSCVVRSSEKKIKRLWTD